MSDKQIPTSGPWHLDERGWCPEADLWENQLLCAAAPELLAACQAARNFGSQGETHDGLSVSEMLRAAIAKATTPQP